MLQAGIYKHYKGNLYQVLNVATHSETSEKLVVYQCLYNDYSIWVRPYEMFIEPVQLEDGQIKPRFEFLHSV
ncbi:DUF1653 domain-containing protein [Acinetobacter rongchengensis]|uniref:DUF1653 domain-containing protein n=1 Tax=Acinetobacter rongchengensis TaxID=2419601 RepID=A0A3A8F441_9GAMM|nr:DUF1653 domain-containing protein [Acinetobacter rongchengensis]RKG35931.1 DUF1653 domain-containing protein [Acinetobacter rongchengensis]